jgi:hypothetical protein
MQPNMMDKTTAVIGADDPIASVFEMYEQLTDENKETINLLIEQLIAEQS